MNIKCSNCRFLRRKNNNDLICLRTFDKTKAQNFCLEYKPKHSFAFEKEGLVDGKSTADLVGADYAEEMGDVATARYIRVYHLIHDKII